MPPSNVLGYAKQSIWSSPGAYASALKRLPADPARLPASLANLLVHFASAEASGTATPQTRTDKRVRRVSDLLAVLLGRNPEPLTGRRDGGHRAVVACRHFALLAASRLRLESIPARVRVGFAAYFIPGFHEDHWVCEYWDGACWKLLDAELDAPTRGRLGIAFSSGDVPRTSFLTAGAAWQAVRSGELAEEHLGVSALGIAGLWFAAANLMRDLAALTMDELLPWDYWGSARTLGPGSTIKPGEMKRYDRLADLLSPAPESLEQASATLRSLPWARVTASVLSYPDGCPIEEPISPASSIVP